MLQYCAIVTVLIALAACQTCPYAPDQETPSLKDEINRVYRDQRAPVSLFWANYDKYRTLLYESKTYGEYMYKLFPSSWLKAGAFNLGHYLSHMSVYQEKPRFPSMYKEKDSRDEKPHAAWIPYLGAKIKELVNVIR